MLYRLFALVLLAVGFTSAARADYVPATWTDSLDVGSGVYIGDSQSYTYTHDLTGDGFRPLMDWVSSFHLAIDLADTNGELELPALAFVDLPDDFSDGFVSNFGLSGEEFGGWSVLGLLELNVFGTLTVTISSIMGDFNLIGSTLTANGVAYVPPRSVPEPGALGLLGIGLMGIALSMRRRQIV